MNELRVALNSGANIAVYPPGATFGPRQMRDFEFVWLLEGDAEYRFEISGQQQEVTLPKGTLLLCQPGRRDQFIWDRTKRTRHGYFHFDLIERQPPWPEPSSWPSTRPMVAGDLLDTLTKQLVNWSATGFAPQRDLMASLLLAAFITGETQAGEVPHQRPPDAVERALAFIYSRLEEDPATPLTLEAIARAAYVTPEHLCRVFKSATGRSPLETVRLARLDRAAVLLSRSNFPVAQVARLTGFASPFHFSRSFKAAYGLSPRELQQSVAAGKAAPLPKLLSRLR
jgi:AraC-like DNA-binding protein